LYNPDRDGNSKLDQVAEMLQGAVYVKQLPFSTVLMDSWYAAKKLMVLIERLGKVCYCLLKTDRLVDDSGEATLTSALTNCIGATRKPTVASSSKSVDSQKINR
jgi:hypothetical protein